METYEIVFLTIEEVQELHEEGIRQYSPGEPTDITNYGLLASAVSTPSQTFEGEYLYHSLFEIAVAYLIGLACNHAFANGNKRVGFAACSTFLRMNGYQLTLTQDEGVNFTLAVVTQKIEREDVVGLLEEAVQML